MVLAGAIVNTTLAVTWFRLDWYDFQLYLVPIGLSVLGLVELLRKEIPKLSHDPLRYVGALTILVSPSLRSSREAGSTYSLDGSLSNRDLTRDWLADTRLSLHRFGISNGRFDRDAYSCNDRSSDLLWAGGLAVDLVLSHWQPFANAIAKLFWREFACYRPS